MHSFDARPSIKRQRVAARFTVSDIRPWLDGGPCESCGQEKRCEYHHPYYSRPAWVIRLCRSCHHKVHSGKLPEPVTGRRLQPVKKRRVIFFDNQGLDWWRYVPTRRPIRLARPPRLQLATAHTWGGPAWLCEALAAVLRPPAESEAA